MLIARVVQLHCTRDTGLYRRKDRRGIILTIDCLLKRSPYAHALINYSNFDEAIAPLLSRDKTLLSSRMFENVTNHFLQAVEHSLVTWRLRTAANENVSKFLRASDDGIVNRMDVGRLHTDYFIAGIPADWNVASSTARGSNLRFVGDSDEIKKTDEVQEGMRRLHIINARNHCQKFLRFARLDEVTNLATCN